MEYMLITIGISVGTVWFILFLSYLDDKANKKALKAGTWAIILISIILQVGVLWLYAETP